MATTTTTSTPDPRVFSFSGLPPLRSLEQSSLPRGYVSFEDGSAAITVAGAGEDQIWRINTDLPIGFAYVLAEVHIWLNGIIADLADWDNAVNGELLFDSPLRSVQFDGLATEDTFGSTTVDRRVYTFPDLPQSILLASDTSSTVGFRVGNHTVDGPAMQGGFFIKFLQYDIEQAHHYGIHTPQLIR